LHFGKLKEGVHSLEVSTQILNVFERLCNLDKFRYPNIDKQYDSHFIRGVFDGDGYLGIVDAGRGYYVYQLTILGEKTFLIDLKKKLPVVYKGGIQDTKQNIHRLQLIVGRNKILSLLNFLYTDATIYLDRKHKKACKIRKQLEV
jgi:intein-encoded DNA endonuclease-like protein